MAQSTYTRPDEIPEFKEKASEQLNRTVERAESAANPVAGQGREGGERMREVAANFNGALDNSVRDQPMATAAAAAIVGFVLGALWKS